MATNQRVIGARAALVLGLLLSAAPASAGGIFNVPSSFRQCFGYGYGAGYHAPLVLQKPCLATTESKNLIYVAHPPKPCGYGCGFSSAATLLETAPASPHQFIAYPTMPTPTPAAEAPTLTPWRGPQPAREPASPSDTPQPELIPLPPPN